MSSLTNALAAADAIQSRVDSELKKPGHKVNSPEEMYKSRIERSKALQHLEETISIVNRALVKIGSCGNKSANEPVKEGLSKDPLTAPSNSTPNQQFDGYLGDSVRPSSATVMKTTMLSHDDQTSVDNLKKTMSADKDEGLGSISPSLSDMAKSIQPIITTFDSVLSKPYLDKYSATLNTVPVVGLKGNSIMYVQTKLDPNPVRTTTDVWSLFGNLPTAAKLDSTQALHFFPYKGDFCVSVGKSVWLRQHRQGNDMDPELKQAVDDWPKMYIDDWTHIGTSALPSDNLLDIVPFSVLSADRTQIAFQLVVLGADSSIRMLTSDSLSDTSEWPTMQYKQTGSSPAVVPAWTRMSYWNNKIVAVDQASNSWNITPDFSAQTFVISDQAKIEPVTEFTASDIGPIGVRSDGYLWKRVVVPPKSDNDDATQEWTRWIKQDGVTNLGVASPGVILDLQTLTKTLKSRYIESQTAIYPVINKIQAFSLTHKFYLGQLKQAATDYDNAGDDEEKQEIAIKNGKGFVKHATVWAKIMGTSSNNAKATVNSMADQLSDVKRQLEVQLLILQDKLKALKATLSAQEGALSHLKAAFWGFVAATLLGLAVAVIGAVTMNFVVCVLAGALFIGGIVGMSVLASKIGALSGDISDTNNQIAVVEQGISELSQVTKSFGDLAGLYATLNAFWGRMSNDSVTLATMDDATALQLGEDVLEDTSSIDTASAVTDAITSGCTTYLDTLNRQGIDIITDSSSFASLPTNHDAKASHVRSLSFKERKFYDTVSKATEQLSAGDIGTYQETMNVALGLHFTALSAQTKVTVAAGTWFDIPSLKSTSSIWKGYSNSVEMGTAVKAMNATTITVGSSMNSDFEKARGQVITLLEETVQLAGTAQSWAEKYPTNPTQNQMKAVGELQQQAVAACERAKTSAAQANNSFTNFNHQATDFQLNVDSQIGDCNGQKLVVRATAASQMNNISIPWYVYLGGVASVAIYEEVQRKSIENELSQTLSNLDSSIQALTYTKNSGLTFNGHALTWMKMVQDVSGSLGSVYNILSGVEGQLLEDPALYAELLHMEWTNLKRNANEVLSILQVQAPVTTLAANFSMTFRGPNSTTDADTTKIIKALSPSSKLGSDLKTQAGKARDTLDNLNTLLSLPFANDIIVTWTEGKTERVPLLDVADHLHRDYVQMLSSQYSTVEQIYALAMLQGTRASNAAAGKLSLKLFANGTLQAIEASYRSAKATKLAFGQTATHFDVLMEQIDSNIKDLQSKIQALDSKLEDADKQLRDKILWEIADVIALAFSVGTILASFGFLGPVTAALSIAAKLGLAATATAASVKVALDALSISDIIKTISALKASRADMQSAVDKLQAVQPLFRAAVTGVNAVADNLNTMKDDISVLSNNTALLAQTKISADDAGKIAHAWSQVQGDCLVWLEFVNSQGISAESFS